MRTIAEIKQVMTEAWMNNETLAAAYGFEVGDSWSDTFGATSIENLLVYIVAVAQHVLERLMGEHKSEVEAIIDSQRAHRPKWYRDKVLEYMDNVDLAEDADGYDTDEYDTSGMTESDIEEAKVVKYAAATESNDSALLTIKVATEDADGELAPLDADVAERLGAYIRRIKDAGVRVTVVNQEADTYSCEMDVWYSAMKSSQSVQTQVKKAIRSYLQGLPFNGEYTNMALTDTIQAVDGVRVVELKSAGVTVDGHYQDTGARYQPAAGYMKAGSLEINMKVYDEQI